MSDRVRWHNHELPSLRICFAGLAQAKFEAQSTELSQQVATIEFETEKRLAEVFEMLMRAEIASFETRETHLSSLLGDLGDTTGTPGLGGGPREVGAEEQKAPY